jgi:beta-N-acetylhexosaminidase
LRPGRRLFINGGLLLLLAICALPATLGPARVADSTPAHRLEATARPSTSSSPSPTPSAVLGGPAPLSLEMAVGQMMAASFGGPTITPGLRHLILDEKVGTVLIFADNFTDARNLTKLTADLQALGQQAGLPAPLLIAVDEEGGRVMRITDGVAGLPSQLALGARGPNTVREAVAANAAGLHRLGIELNLAPVADLRSNPGDAVIGDRSYGSNPLLVGYLVSAAVSGMHEGGIAATLKHFPGLGGAAGDPHAAIPTDYESLSQWAATQARSFQAGIDAGADAVMTTAMVVPGLDPSGTPALFSRTVVTGLLRERLHFQGVIVTDGLGMGGITSRYSLADATVASVRAGNDLVLLNSDDAADEASAIEAVKEQVRRGSIAMEQVQASAGRVIALRARWPAWAPSPVDAAGAAAPIDAAVSDTRR